MDIEPQFEDYHNSIGTAPSTFDLPDFAPTFSAPSFSSSLNLTFNNFNSFELDNIILNPNRFISNIDIFPLDGVETNPSFSLSDPESTFVQQQIEFLLPDPLTEYNLVLLEATPNSLEIDPITGEPISSLRDPNNINIVPDNNGFIVSERLSDPNILSNSHPLRLHSSLNSILPIHDPSVSQEPLVNLTNNNVFAPNPEPTNTAPNLVEPTPQTAPPPNVHFGINHITAMPKELPC